VIKPAPVLDEFATPQSVVEDAYRYISFAPGEEPRWGDFKRLFDTRSVLALRLFPKDKQVTVMSLDEYVQMQVTEGMKAEGYEEKILSTNYKMTGDIAEAHVHFQMVFAGDRIHDAIDIFQLVRREGRWWIVSIISEII
jgi:hypothetical protein